MKKYTLALALLLLPGLTLAGFADVDNNHPNFESINYVQAETIVNGYADGTFKPDGLINRAELAKILVAANFDQSLIDTCNLEAMGFSDVPIDAWFAPFVCIAQEANIIKGYEDGTFKPAQNVNFVEAAKMISLSFGNTVSPSGDNWYTPYVRVLSEQKAIPASISSFEKNISRGEMAEMVYRLHANVLTKDSLSFQENQLVMNPSPGTETKTEVPAETEAPTPGQYLLLDGKAWDAALGNKMIALFFHADWCPTCRTADTEINDRLLEIPANSVIFKVDYDNEKELRKQFGVTQQHTAVFINREKEATFRKAGFSFQDLVDNL